MAAYTRRFVFALVAWLLSACGGTVMNTDAPLDTTDAGGAESAAIDVVDSGGIDAGDAPPNDATDVSPLDVVDNFDTNRPDVAATDASDAVRTDTPTTRVPQYHRVDDSACLAPAPPGNCSSGGGPGACSMDTDCTGGGRCNMNLNGARFCRCTLDTCARDTDCPTGQACACHGSAFTEATGSQCVPGNCRTDSDCGANGFCSPAHGNPGCGGITGYYCHTATDRCIDDADCNDGGITQVCTYSTSSQRWECTQRNFCP